MLGCGTALFGQTAPPDALRALLIGARGHAGEHLDTRGATPGLTQVKHSLLGWIESRLTLLIQRNEEAALAFQLNAELRKSGLSCNDLPESNEVQCPEQTLIGYLGEINLRRSGEFLVVQTAVGIDCGNDESAYIYEWKDDRWQRIWESEQNDYTKEKYLPQHLQAVLISPTDYRPDGDKSKHLVVTLGNYPWCSSNWQTVYYRIWRTTNSGGNPQLMLDENEVAFISEPVQASVWPRDVLIEYAVASADMGVHNRRQIRHYVLEHDSLKRTDPLVLSPRDFVDYWLTSPLNEILERTPANLRLAMQNWHRKFNGPFEFIGSTRHCTEKQDLWQVGIQNPDTERPLGYFQIRWRPPYHFSIVGLSERPWPSCAEEDRQADEFRTLFPDRDWHDFDQ
jgi:hypothetical protein